MGCDIHLYVEKKIQDGFWVSADSWVPNPYAEEEGPALCVPYEKRFYKDRNYHLFGMLANVRNGRGFAGIKTGEGYWPISNPKRLPHDVSTEVKCEADQWGDDGHSHSWLTVQELLEYDWTQVTVCRGFLNARTYHEWNQWNRKNGESPTEWCGAVSGAVVKVTEERMLELIGSRDDDLSDLASTYCQVEWQVPYYKAARHFLSDAMPRLWRLGSPENVRIVFWFDN